MSEAVTNAIVESIVNEFSGTSKLLLLLMLLVMLETTCVNAGDINVHKSLLMLLLMLFSFPVNTTCESAIVKMLSNNKLLDTGDVFIEECSSGVTGIIEVVVAETILVRVEAAAAVVAVVVAAVVMIALLTVVAIESPVMPVLAISIIDAVVGSIIVCYSCYTSILFDCPL